MRLLFLTQVLPYPLDAGPKVRAYYTLRHLARQGHEVSLVSLVRATDSPEAVAHLESFCKRVVPVPIRRTRAGEALAVVRSLVTRQPLLITRDHVPALVRSVRALAETGYDLIHADQLWMAPYALQAGRASAQTPRLILDQHNAVFQVPHRLAAGASNPLLRLGYRREAARMKAYEVATCLKFDRVVTVTEQDRETLLALYPRGPKPSFSAAIPICVDPEAWHPAPAAPRPDELLFVGGMHWPPNADGVLWFARQVLPLIHQRLPAVRFTAVGRVPASLAPLREAQVTLPGFVEDLEPYWARSPLFMVPLRAGGGMRVKILEAWARGLAVVSTSVGAEGLAWRQGENILVADTPDEFAAAVLRLNAEPALAAELARQGRATVEQHYDWRKIYSAWDEAYAVTA